MESYSASIPWGNVYDDYEWKPSTYLLGVGAQGKVCKALCKKARVGTDLKVGDWYAIKVISKETSKMSEVFHEIEILRHLNSPHCVRLFDVFQSFTSYFIVLEYVDGGELLNVISEKKQLTEKEALGIIRQLLEALRYLHFEQRIVHRDLKPENILMTKDGLNIKLVDFGFAKFFGQPRPATSGAGHAAGPPRELRLDTHHGFTPPPTTPERQISLTPYGTMHYCAPEIHQVLLQGTQRTTTREAIQKLDTFSVGVVTYVLLGGRWPFPAKEHTEALAQIERGLSFPDEQFKRVSDSAKDFCRRLMHPNPTTRLSALGACAHPWISSSAPSTPLHSQALCQTASFVSAMVDGLRAQDTQREQVEEAVQVVPIRKKEANIVLKSPTKPDKGQTVPAKAKETNIILTPTKVEEAVQVVPVVKKEANIVLQSPAKPDKIQTVSAQQKETNIIWTPTKGVRKHCSDPSSSSKSPFVCFPAISPRSA